MASWVAGMHLLLVEWEASRGTLLVRAHAGVSGQVEAVGSGPRSCSTRTLSCVCLSRCPLVLMVEFVDPLGRGGRGRLSYRDVGDQRGDFNLLLVYWLRGALERTQWEELVDSFCVHICIFSHCVRDSVL